MILSLSIGPRTLLNDCNHVATASVWRSENIQLYYLSDRKKAASLPCYRH